MPSTLLTQNEWPLQLWTQVPGSVPGELLGQFVTSIKPTANFPYRVAICRGDSVGVYTLQSPNDTIPKMKFPGVYFLSGDLNGDGYTDVVTGTRHIMGPYTGYDTVRLYWGNAGGVDTTNPLIFASENRSDEVGPGCIADVNNDGYMDLVLLAPAYPKGSANGKVYIYFGPNITTTPSAVLVGDTARMELGLSAAVGDLNGDGFNDLVLTGMKDYDADSTRYSYVNIYWGAKDSLSLTSPFQIRGYESPQSAGVMRVFDANGDGVADLLWVNRDSLVALSSVFVHFGRPMFSKIPDLKLKDPGYGGFGISIANAGDMNGDGYDDIAVGAAGPIYSGGVFVFSGGPKMDGNYDAAATFNITSLFGQAITSVGDINGDSLSDILVGAPSYKSDEDRGYWAVLLGSENIPVTKVNEEDKREVPSHFELYQNYPNPFNPTTKIEFSISTTSFTTLRVFDILGREATTLVAETLNPGHYTRKWNAERYSSGVYFYSLTSRNSHLIKKMILQK
jgi:Secretion system C-terminal sorting domain/FG-GAP-like repeat/FG-GAP repeat